MSLRCWGVNWIVFIAPSRQPHGSDHRGVPPLPPSAIVGSSGPARLYLGDAWPDGGVDTEAYLRQDLVEIRDSMLGLTRDQQGSVIFLDVLRELLQFKKVRIEG